ncbi:MAG: ABC transporter ATP-binding protein [Lachnospiraceae bacterium]
MMYKKEKSPKKKRNYTRSGSIVWALKKLWRLDKRFVFFIFATVPVAVILPLLNSYFAKVLIDSLGRGESFETLTFLVLSFTMAGILLNLLDSYIENSCFARVYYPTSIYQTEIGEQENYYADYETTEKQDFKEISGHVWGDATRGDCALEFLWKDLSKTLTDAFGMLTYASILLVLNPVIVIVVAFVSVLSYVTARWQTVYFEKNKHSWEKEERKKGYLQRLSGDFSMAKDIKLYGLEGWLDSMMKDYQSYLLMWKKRCSLRGVWASILSGFMTLVQDGVAYLVLLGLLLDGGITVGEFVFYFGLVGSIAGCLNGIIGDIAKLSTRADKIDYYREFYDYPNRFHHGKGCELPASPVKIELKDVRYRYDGAKEDTLKGINLVIEPGESLALVGINGAGKTTLIKLICGLYTPTEGEILVGGRKIEEYNVEEYYSMISAVFQEIRAVAFTIFEFVASTDMERRTAREDAIAAMRAAGIYEKVEGLANGMDTHLMKGIYDDGVDFSGGEMQKLVLARAIYKNGAILVLDEPTAALDPIAENQLYLKYRALTKGKTSVYISHRFASTRFCDRIVLLEDGIIKESGTHEELMRLGGRYAEMFEVQSRYYKEGEVNA